jgi:hypothetical protein
MGRLTFQISDQQHQEWFIAGLLPHIHRPLIQQKVASLLVTYTLRATILGMTQVQVYYGFQQKPSKTIVPSGKIRRQHSTKGAMHSLT